MALSAFARNGTRFIRHNSPAILTGLGVAGLFSTAVLAVRGTIPAIRAIDEASRRAVFNESEPDENGNVSAGVEYEDVHLELKDYVQLTWKHYIPAVSVAVLTAGCIISANTLNSRRNAALISAYALAETGFREYREKVVEEIGEKKEEVIREKVIQDRMKENPPPPAEHMLVVAGQSQLCLDKLSGRYFMSDVETIRKAQNDINQKCINEMYASMNDFYALLGLSPIEIGEVVGWNTDNMLEIMFTTTLSEDSRPCLAIDYRRQPEMDYHRLWR